MRKLSIARLSTMAMPPRRLRMARPCREFEQVAAKQHDGAEQDPDEEIDCGRAAERDRSDRDRRNAGQPAVAVERVEIAEHEIDGDAPGDGAERQEMSAEPQRCCAQDRGSEAGQRQSKQQSDPRRAALHRRVPSRRVGADTDERGLAERRQPADAGEQHKAQRRKRIDADVVHQRDGEGPEQRRCDRDEGNG